MALTGGQVGFTGYQRPDYSGVAEAAALPAQQMAGMVQKVGDYFKQQGEKKKLIKQSDIQIDAALKLFPDLAPALQGYRDQLKDENLPLDERTAIADSISNIINMGVSEMRNAQSTLLQQQKLGLEQQYKAARLGMEEEKVDIARQQAAKGPAPKFEIRRPTITSPTGKVFEGPELPYDESRGMFFDTKAQKYIADPNLIGTGQEYAPDSAMPTSTSQLMPSDGKFGFTYKTRDLLPASTANARQISLDFNAAANKNAKGIEIIIPNNASDIERALALDYVNKTKDFFASKGVDVPVRGVRTAAENKRGSANRFHTEPFFVNDAASRAAIESDPDGYAQVLADTIGKIPGAMFIPPHKSNDPGASANGINERDFAKSVLIPALERLSTQEPTASIGTPQQQAEVARMIEQGAGMATAQNMPQGAVPTEPSMATRQPQLPQQDTPQWSPPAGFVPKRGKFRDFTSEEVARYGSPGQVNIETGEVRPIRPPSGMVIEQTPEGGFRVVQGAGVGGRQEQVQKAQQEQKTSRSVMGTQEIGRALEVLDSGVMQGSGPLASFYRAGASKFIKGTPEYKLANEFIAPIKSMLAFDELNKMRAASPTGGALGNVAKFETDMLQQTAGQLDIDKADPKTIRENLMRLSEKYLDAVHGTIQDREKLLRDDKISKETFLEILSLYPPFTMGAKGEMTPRQAPQTEQAPAETEAERILRELGE